MAEYLLFVECLLLFVILNLLLQLANFEVCQFNWVHFLLHQFNGDGSFPPHHCPIHESDGSFLNYNVIEVFSEVLVETNGIQGAAPQYFPLRDEAAIDELTVPLESMGVIDLYVELIGISTQTETYIEVVKECLEREGLPLLISQIHHTRVEY
jgi:hypothetical protein